MSADCWASAAGAVSAGGLPSAGNWVAVDGGVDVLEDCRKDVLVTIEFNISEEDSRAATLAVEIDGDGTACVIEVSASKSEPGGATVGAAVAEGAACNEESGLKSDDTDDGACEKDGAIPGLKIEVGRVGID